MVRLIQHVSRNIPIFFYLTYRTEYMSGVELNIERMLIHRTGKSRKLSKNGYSYT